MSSAMADPQPDQSAAAGVVRDQPMVVGLYGLPGCGKTYLLNQLKQELGQERFAFYEGSDVIAGLVPGGVAAFQAMNERDKEELRKLAINKIGKDCTNHQKVAVVTGHFMFWPEEEEAGREVYTENDLNTFTHILYLDVPVEDVARYRNADTARSRPPTFLGRLDQWQQVEKPRLRDLCYQHRILFSIVKSRPTLVERISLLLKDFLQNTEELNLTNARNMLDEMILANRNQLETVLVMDADRTLAAADTGRLFWEIVNKCQQSKDQEGLEESPLTMLFESNLQYSYAAFRQAALLYEETADDNEFDEICHAVASSVTLHREFVTLLQKVARVDHVGAVIVTCGLRRIWEKVLEREGLSNGVKVIGGGRIGEDFIVTAKVKATLTSHLRDAHELYVCAFGDSPLDLEMLSKADQAVVVVGEEHNRSKSMDMALINAIDNKGLKARQILLPSHASPRLDIAKLPLVQLTDPDFANLVFCRRPRGPTLQVLHATDKNATKLLATKMRDAAVAGPSLRQAHRQAGWYLGTEFVANVIGLEKSSIQHVLNRPTSGYQLLHEKQTTIVALMRGGEPMAYGVNDAFPLAMFVYAGDADDIKLHHLQGQLMVILVDSVINTGETIIEFVQHVRRLHATIRVVVVAGVIQAQCVFRGSRFSKSLAHHDDLDVVALRLSQTKFKGSGTNDTGNRLFNTTHLP